tara:strand:+ start:1402 stop:2619 length:1218 start_codon:yes stop_codon:yes gene_type:complete
MLKNQVSVVFFMTALITVGHISTNIYMPSMPAMALFFSTDMEHIQLTVSAYLAAFAFGQLVYGPISDRFGRKPVLIIGLSIFLLATLVSVCTPLFYKSINILILLRAVQALGASAGPIIARAIMRDLYSKNMMAKMMSYVAIAMGLAPAFAPILGGYLEIWFDWRASFLVILLFCAIVLLLSFFALSETNKYRDYNSSEKPITIITNYFILSKELIYWRYTLIGSFVFAGMFAFMTTAPFVVINLLGYNAVVYGWASFTAIIGYMMGSFALSRLADKQNIEDLIPLGSLIIAIFSLILFVLGLLGEFSLFSLFFPLTGMAFGMAIMFPSTMAGAISIYPRIAGAGAALYGFIQMVIAALVVWLVSKLSNDSHLPLIWVVSFSMLLSCLFAFLGPKKLNNKSEKIN